jgi:hypothetical protein
MCMSTVKREVKTGYKICFISQRDKNVVLTGCNSHPIKVGEWTEDKQLIILGSGEDQYICGFHIYPTMQDVQASIYVGEVYEVEYTDIVAEGTESDSNVVIARRIKIGKFVGFHS